MKTYPRWSGILLIIGFIAMIIGMIDPLEGSIVILAGSFIVAVAAFLGRSKRSRILYTAFGLVVIGVGLLFWISSLGGVGGETGRSYWWLLIVLPYPAGWITGIVGSIKMMRDRRREQGSGEKGTGRRGDEETSRWGDGHRA